MSRIPFTVYDIFAYLSSGTLLVAAIDYLYGPRWLLNPSDSGVLVLAFLIASYVAGHIISQFSSAIIEGWVVATILLRPSRTLMGERRPLLSWFFPLYYRKLPDATQERVREAAARRRFRGTGEALFAHAFGVIKQNAATMDRLSQFRNLYGFARNVSFSFLVIAVLWQIGPVDNRSVVAFPWAPVFLLAGLTMFYRYLKFHRQYSYELFLSFAEFDDSKDTRDGNHN